MKSAAIALAGLMIAVPAQAVSRYTATTMSCDSLQGSIDRDGAAIVYFRSKTSGVPPLFARFVRNELFCQGTEVGQPRYVPTADNKSCPVLGCIDYDIRPENNNR